ncbi:MAG: type II toxin-antitoxin system HicA family toxin [Bacteroidetes bacterium]|nr:type II toxin-antitoxin system HicA family toxin [Bacteroidota bacterium]MCL5738608.1 type II toxin-antitoxin system HicA family toxin [Bacteroidota bacterium]
MPELRSVSGEEAIKALEHLGFRRVRQRGSHVILKKSTPTGDVGCVVPLHKQLKVGTLHGILKLAKVEVEDFQRNL